MKALVKHAFRLLLVLLLSVSVAFAQTHPAAPRNAAATQPDRKSTRLNSSHMVQSRMPSSA